MHSGHGTARVIVPLMAVWAVGLTLLSWRTGVQHDYPYYLQQWALVGTDVSPWATDQGFPPNTYGPLHAALAPLADFYPLAPKVLFSGLFAISCLVISREVVHARPDARTLVLLVALIPANILVLTVAGVQGDNDVLVGALVGFAIVLKLRQHALMAGVLLGIGILVKYYPLVVLLMLCLDRRRWDWRPIAGSLLVIVPVGAISLMTLGGEVLDAVAFGGSRAATYLSPLRALEYLTDGQPGSIADVLSRGNALIVAAVMLVSLALAYRLGLTWLQGATVSLWGVLVSYKVGHAQYYLALMLMLALLLIFKDKRSQRAVLALIPFVAFLEIFQLLYMLQSQGVAFGALPLADLTGVATTFFAAATLLGIIWALRSPPDTPVGQAALEAV